MYETFLAKANFVGTGMEMPYTVIIGVCSVFAGLICIILLCKIIGLICGGVKKDKSTAKTQVAQAVQAAPQPIENRQQIIAAVSAAVAEELGTDVSAIRIISFKKI